MPYTPYGYMPGGYAPGYAPGYFLPGQAMSAQNHFAQPSPGQAPCGMIWVQGEAGAKAYLVANGNTVPLWDSEAPYVYIKTVDLSGVPSMRRLRTVDETGTADARNSIQPPTIDLSGYVTREELDGIFAERLARQAPKPAQRTAKAREGQEDG